VYQKYKTNSSSRD